MQWIVKLGSGLVMLVAVAVGTVYLIPAEQVAARAALEFGKATGRELVLEGQVKPSIWPVLGVKTGPVRIANAAWSDLGPLLQAEGLSIGVDLAALIGGTVRITKVEAIAPQILLEKNKKGQVNWVFDLPATVDGSAGAGGMGAGTARVVSLDQGLIHKGRLRYIDHANGTTLELTQIEAEARLPDFAGEASLTLSAQKGGQALLAEAKIARFSDFAAGKVSGLRFTGGVGGSGFKFDGRMGVAPMVAEGAVTADLGDMAALTALIGLPAPDLPQGLGKKTRQIAGQVTLAPARSVHLRGGVISLDDNRFEADADLRFEGGKPNLTASVKTGALRLASLTAQSGGGGGVAANGTAAGWSRETIDVGGLGALDAAVSLAADSIDLGTLKFGKARLMITLVKSRAVIEARDLQAYGGGITGEFVVNGRGGLSVGGNLKLAGLAMQPLLTDLARFDRLIGATDFNMRFLGVGNSMAAIAASLSGEGKMQFGKGELRGLDLLGMLRNLDPSYIGEGSKTIFDAVNASFTLQNGVLYNEDLVLSAPYLKAQGKGRVGIGARDLEYRVVPTALEKQDGSGGIRVPLMITGPWAKPRFQLDLKALADQELADEKAKLKERAKQEADKARAQLQAKAEKELGVTRQEGESLEDAARRRAQEALDQEAAKLLNGLFGGN